MLFRIFCAVISNFATALNRYRTFVLPAARLHPSDAIFNAAQKKNLGNIQVFPGGMFPLVFREYPLVSSHIHRQLFRACHRGDGGFPKENVLMEVQKL